MYNFLNENFIKNRHFDTINKNITWHNGVIRKAS